MNYYRNNRRAGKKNQSCERNSDKQSSPTKENTNAVFVNNGSRKRKHNYSHLNDVRISTKNSENHECRSKTHEQKNKWNSYMNYYRNNRRAGKMNQSYECNSDKQSSPTKENTNAVLVNN